MTRGWSWFALNQDFSSWIPFNGRSAGACAAAGHAESDQSATATATPRNRQAFVILRFYDPIPMRGQ